MAKPINVTIKGDYTDRDINRAIRDLERLKTQSAMTGGVLGGFQKSMVAAGGALAAAPLAKWLTRPLRYTNLAKHFLVNLLFEVLCPRFRFWNWPGVDGNLIFGRCA